MPRNFRPICHQTAQHAASRKSLANNFSLSSGVTFPNIWCSAAPMLDRRDFLTRKCQKNNMSSWRWTVVLAWLSNNYRLKKSNKKFEWILFTQFSFTRRLLFLVDEVAKNTLGDDRRLAVLTMFWWMHCHMLHSVIPLKFPPEPILPYKVVLSNNIHGKTTQDGN